MQLACTVQIPKCFKGIDGKCVYIDTEGGFYGKRVAAIADSLKLHLVEVSRRTKREKIIETAKSMNVIEMLESIYVFRVLNLNELVNLITVKLKPFIEDLVLKGTNVKLLVIDSIAFHFRYGLDNMAHRARVLMSIAQALTQLCRLFDLAVFIVNHASVVSTNQPLLLSSQSIIQPALGIQWSKISHTRISLFWKGNHRFAHRQYDFLSKEDNVGSFVITNDGIRDLDEADEDTSITENADAAEIWDDPPLDENL
jgi:RAD51-like protein 2